MNKGNLHLLAFSLRHIINCCSKITTPNAKLKRNILSLKAYKRSGPNRKAQFSERCLKPVINKNKVLQEKHTFYSVHVEKYGPCRNSSIIVCTLKGYLVRLQLIRKTKSHRKT